MGTQNKYYGLEMDEEVPYNARILEPQIFKMSWGYAERRDNHLLRIVFQGSYSSPATILITSKIMEGI